MGAKTITLDTINGGPNFTTSPTVPTPAVGDNSQAAAPTAFITAAVGVEASARIAAINSLTTAVNAASAAAATAVQVANLGTAGNPFALDLNRNISGQSLGNNHSGYPTFASLSNFPYATATNQDYVDIPCFSTAGDFGGGRFIWIASSTAAALTGFVVNPTGNTGNGRLIRQVVGNLRPEMAGGVGDNGTTDNSAAFTVLNTYISINALLFQQTVIEFNGLSFGTTLPWTPQPNTTPQNGKLLAMAGGSWSSTTGVLNVTYGNVKPVNFTVDCGFIANAQGVYLTSTTGFAPNGLIIQRWSTTGGNGLVNNGGKVNNSGPVNIYQYTAGDAGYSQPWNWTGYGVQNIGVADNKFQQFVVSKCGIPIFFDETCLTNTISCCHPFNGGNGTVIQNVVLIEDRGYGNIYIGNEIDSGCIMLTINAQSHSLSPPTVNATFIANTWIVGSTNATFPAFFRIRTTKNNTTINYLNVIGNDIPTNTTVPNFSFEFYGTSQGTATQASATTNSTSLTLSFQSGTTPAVGMLAEGYGIPAKTTVVGGTWPNLTLSTPVTLRSNTVITFTVMTGSFASTLNTTLMSAQTGPFQYVGGGSNNATNVMNNQNFGGYGSVFGNLAYPATLNDMGRATTAQDSNCTFFANTTNKPVVLSCAAPKGQKVTVTVGGVSALITTATSVTSYGATNVGNTTVGSITFLSGATLGNYLLTALTATTFSVVDPSGVNLGTATIGTAFTSAEIDLLLTAGATATAVGDLITVINNTGTASLNNVTGGSLNLPISCRWEFECVQNSNGTNAVWAGTGNIPGPLQNRSISTSQTLLLTDLGGSVFVNTAGVVLSVPYNAPANSFCVITTNSSQGCSIATDGAGALIQGSASSTLSLPDDSVIIAYVINNSGSAANWGFIGLPVTSGRVITATSPLTSADNGSVIAINNGSTAVTINLIATMGNFSADMSIIGTGTVTFTAGSGAFVNGGTAGGSVSFTNSGSAMMSLRVTQQYNPNGTTAHWFVK